MQRTLVTLMLALLTPSWALAQAVARDEAKLWSGQQLQIELGAIYARGRSHVIDERLPILRPDLGLASIGLWYGLSDRIQISATLPYLTAGSTWDESRTDGLGDISGQLDVRLRGDALDSTALLLEVGATAPTGAKPVGGGGWLGFAGLRAFKRLDPILEFGEIAYAHGFEQGLAGGRVRPGPTVRAQGGLGLRIDDSKIVWLKTSSAYQLPTQLNGQVVRGSDRLESTLGIALNWAMRPDLLLEWSTAAGLSSDAPDVALGVGLIYTLPGRR